MSPSKPAWDSHVRPFLKFKAEGESLFEKKPIIKDKAGQIKEFFW